MKRIWKWGIGLGTVLVFIWVAQALFGNACHGEVVIIPVEGMIAVSDHFVEDLDKVRKDARVKAVVVRINSPGGAVAASQEMAAALQKLDKEKPVVVSMGDVAASGGYYIAAPARYIFANPGTITASIGVRMEHVEIEQLLNWAKIKHQTLKSGAMKDIGAFDRPMRPEERAFLQNILDEMHEQFIKYVADARHLKIEDVRKVADGRVITGATALQHHLVDALGGVNDAIAKAAELAGIKGEPEVTRLEDGPPWWRTLMFDSMTSIVQKAMGATQTMRKAVYQW